MPESVVVGQDQRFVIPARLLQPFQFWSEDAHVRFEKPQYVALPVAEIRLPGGVSRPALKSEETPIETLRLIPGFVENTEAP